jgi:hypothetical protein
VVRSGSRSELVVVPEATDFDELSLTGFAASAVEKLRVQSRLQGADGEQAADALGLLVRLMGRTT